MYKTFIRNWYKKSASGAIEPGPGRKSWGNSYYTEDEAREACSRYNSTHEPGKLSRKMEYTSNC